MTTPLRTALVGCRGMGQHHARHAAALPHFQIVAGCDLDTSLVEQFSGQHDGARGYTDYEQMLREVEPDVVIVATTTAPHAKLTIAAAEAGARGVFCEKPMAVSLGEARAMFEACRKNNTALVVNHQRRTSAVFKEMRRLMESGAIGKVQLIRGSCAGDILSDGTHVIDTIRYLTSDADAKWVFGQICRDPGDANESGQTGFRYGHAVESGGFGLIEFVNGMRAEIHTGTMQMKGRGYQDYEVFGSEGRLWRAGDRCDPALQIQDAQSGGWRPVEFDDPQDEWRHNYEQFARMVLEGADHPLSGASALKDQELVMAIYESSRLRRKIELPLQQDAFPLQLMIDAGQL
jgi:predicted dehydrogenase